MQYLFSTLLLCAVVFGPRPAVAACGDRAEDADAVAAARAAAESRCDCASAVSHARHVYCVATVADEAIAAGTLRRQCRRVVVRCGVRSTCGRPGTVACCRTTAAGRDRCGIRDGAACTAPAGGTVCAAADASCCDACASACTPSTTTTTLPGSGCARDAECDDGNPCTDDRCVAGECVHECLCVGPTGGFTCCPGPAAQCGPLWFATCGDPVCSVHRDQGVRPCGPGETAGAACSPDGAKCDPGSECNELLLCATSDPTHGGMCPVSLRR